MRSFLTTLICLLLSRAINGPSGSRCRVLCQVLALQQGLPVAGRSTGTPAERSSRKRGRHRRRHGRPSTAAAAAATTATTTTARPARRRRRQQQQPPTAHIRAGAYCYQHVFIIDFIIGLVVFIDGPPPTAEASARLPPVQRHLRRERRTGTARADSLPHRSSGNSINPAA